MSRVGRDARHRVLIAHDDLSTPTGSDVRRSPSVGAYGRTVAEPVADVLGLQTVNQLREALSADVLRDLHNVFDELLPARLAAIENALRCGDRGELRRAAHLLGGSSMMLGATRLGQVCRQLEDTAAGDDPVVIESQAVRLAAVATEARQALRDHLA
jgi:HPt (histidine-containing phosphotransfer) domain-containing protein